MTVTERKRQFPVETIQLENAATAGRQDFFFEPVTIGGCSNRRDNQARDVTSVQHEGSRGPS